MLLYSWAILYHDWLYIKYINSKQRPQKRPKKIEKEKSEGYMITEQQEHELQDHFPFFFLYKNKHTEK